jgi:uncharacterized protein (TIGR00369 family)
MATRREVKKTTGKGRMESSRSSKAEKSKTAALRRSRSRADGSKHQKNAPKSSSSSAPKLVPVPFPGGLRPQKGQEMNERSAHLEKLKQLFESAPISRHLGMNLGYCENGVARVRLPYRKDFEEGHGIIHGGLIGLLADTAGSFAVGSMSPGSTVKTVEFKMSLLAGVQGDLLAIGEVVRKGRTLATCRLEVVEGNDRVVAIGLATYALQAV